MLDQAILEEGKHTLIALGGSVNEEASVTTETGSDEDQ